MRKILTTIIIAAIMLISICNPAFSDSAESSYTRNYNWHGFKVFGDRYVHPGVNTSISGIDVGVTSHYENEGNDLKKWDTAIGYDLGGNFSAAYKYLIFPGTDIQDASLTANLPGPIPLRYTIAHVVPDDDDAGQFHTLGIDIDLGDYSDPNAVTACLLGEITYNDGVNPFGETVIRALTHATIGLTVNVPMDDVVFSPGIVYQHTFEAVVEDDRNDVWYVAAMNYRF